MKNQLQVIAEKYGTDKANFGYAEIYNKYLRKRRDSITSLLEIGIKKGSSIKMWRDYLKNANIVGLDIDPGTMMPTEKRISTWVFDQGSDAVGYELIIKLMLSESLPTFDVIVDDGSHWQQHIIKSFNYFYPILSSGGYYFIEDVANEEISLKNGKTWGSVEPDFSDSAIKVFEKKKSDGELDIDIYYAQKEPLTDMATSDFIVIKKG